jgi:hypothetical protein
MHASAYVHEGNLIIIGLAKTKDGVVPFCHRRRLRGEAPDGPVVFGSELPPAVQEGLNRADGPITWQIEKEAMRSAAESLVERARNGDQNAVAIIIEVRKNAQAGKQKAKIAYSLLKDYITNNPNGQQHHTFRGESQVKFKSPIGALRIASQKVKDAYEYAATVSSHIEAVGPTFEGSEQAANVLADGPAVTDELLASVQNSLPSGKEAFKVGVKASRHKRQIADIAKKVSKEEKRCLQIGYVLGVARSIQMVRLDEVPCAILSPDVGWELDSIVPAQMGA